MAQEINRMSYHYGASFKMTSDPFLYEVSPSIGVGFRIDTSNTVGLGAQTDISFYKQDPSPVRSNGITLLSLYAFYLHDFSSDKQMNYYNEFKLGLSDPVKPGIMIGFEPGLRFKLSDWGSLRLGLSAQASRLTYIDRVRDAFQTIEYAVGINAKIEI